MYQAIYRKYRPMRFCDVFGQKHITGTLVNQLNTGHVSHAYLFTGTRGTGKTTCAKILARAVNCENLVNGDPCGVCPACQSILDGSAVDVTELDAASNTGVDNMRSILDETLYLPSELKMRVYIIDEVHMLSIGAFNALLKTLEEPPPHVLFILATTELHKVPATILSRCQRFDFRRVEQKEIAANLSHISELEKIPLTGGAIGLLARLADGSVRDSLSLLERCAAQTLDVIDENTVLSCVGISSDDSLYALARAICAYDAAGALGQIAAFYKDGCDLRSLFDSFCALMRDVLIVKTVPNSWEELINPGTDAKSVKALGEMFSSERIGTIITSISDTMNKMQRSGGTRTEAELCIIKLCTAEIQHSGGTEDIFARLEAIEKKLRDGIVPSPQVSKTDEPHAEIKVPKTIEKPTAPAFQGELISNDKVKAILLELKPKLNRSAYATLSMTQIVKLGGRIRIIVDDDLSMRVLNDHAVKTEIGKAGSHVLGNDVPIEVVTEEAAQAPEVFSDKNGFDMLEELGRASGIDVNIK